MTAARIREDGSFGGCGEGTEEDEGGGGGAVSQDGVGIGWSQRCRYPSAVAAGACEDDSTKQQLRRDMEAPARSLLRLSVTTCPEETYCQLTTGEWPPHEFVALCKRLRSQEQQWLVGAKRRKKKKKGGGIC